MATPKSYNNITTSVALMLVVLVLACQIMSAHCNIASTTTKSGMMEGTITPAEGGVPGATEDVRPTNPSHSPGIGHAFTHSRIGRKLLTTISQ
ncbi:hypothetical protein BDA96_01G371700 [Sorghum bicolor]|uniref:Transmembrane protein n=2 Tax=Sorghum bicolor TaxID=4558 RepID=A0A921S3J5_SORBI|nr:hypothetical protein BDA96_01G371700 [Sorghum bicolor]KXG39213.1 hypothetical protein SORBI_3001G348400 [Sorghum bicolor]